MPNLNTIFPAREKMNYIMATKTQPGLQLDIPPQYAGVWAYALYSRTVSYKNTPFDNPGRGAFFTVLNDALASLKELLTKREIDKLLLNTELLENKPGVITYTADYVVLKIQLLNKDYLTAIDKVREDQRKLVNDPVLSAVLAYRKLPEPEQALRFTRYTSEKAFAVPYEIYQVGHSDPNNADRYTAVCAFTDVHDAEAYCQHLNKGSETRHEVIAAPLIDRDIHTLFMSNNTDLIAKLESLDEYSLAILGL